MQWMEGRGQFCSWYFGMIALYMLACLVLCELNIPQVMINMRLGGASNRSLANIIRKSREDYRALHHNGIGGLWALACKNFSKLPQFFKR